MFNFLKKYWFLMFVAVFSTALFFLCSLMAHIRSTEVIFKINSFILSHRLWILPIWALISVFFFGFWQKKVQAAQKDGVKTRQIKRLNLIRNLVLMGMFLCLLGVVL